MYPAHLSTPPKTNLGEDPPAAQGLDASCIRMMTGVSIKRQGFLGMAGWKREKGMTR